jgi:hypothetical protein
VVVTTNFHFATTREPDGHLSNVLRLLRVKDYIALDSITWVVERARVNDFNPQGHRGMKCKLVGLEGGHWVMLDGNDE